MRTVPACTVALLGLVGLGCGDGDGPLGNNGTVDPTTGSLLVSLVVSGGDMDSDGCTVTVDGGSAQRVSAGASVAFSHLSAGAHVVVIGDVADNCQVDGGASRNVTVIAAQTARETFTVVCDLKPRIELSATELNFAGIVGAYEVPAPQSIEITNAGDQPLTDLEVSATYSGEDGWLLASLDTTAAPSTLPVSVDLDGLSAGAYFATITITSPVAVNSPQTVEVVLDLPYTLIVLGTFYGTQNDALGINEAGQIVGRGKWTADAVTKHAFLWDRGEISDLGTLGGDSSHALDINDAGQVVGYSRINPGSTVSHAFLWQDGVMTDLGTLEGGAALLPGPSTI